jgi:hypothetical protein
MLVEDSSNPPHSGTFTINNGGTAPVAASLSLPDSTTISGTGSLTVDTFTSNFSSPVATGNTTVAVGATLHVPAAAEAGDYTGQYTVTLSY